MGCTRGTRREACTFPGGKGQKARHHQDCRGREGRAEKRKGTDQNLGSRVEGFGALALAIIPRRSLGFIDTRQQESAERQASHPVKPRVALLLGSLLNPKP